MQSLLAVDQKVSNRRTCKELAIYLTKKSIEDLIAQIMDSIYLSSDDQLILDEASEYNSENYKTKVVMYG